MDTEIIAIAMKLVKGSINIAKAVKQNRGLCFTLLHDLMMKMRRSWGSCSMKDLNIGNVFYSLTKRRWTFVNWKFAEIFP